MDPNNRPDQDSSLPPPIPGSPAESAQQPSHGQPPVPPEEMLRRSLVELKKYISPLVPLLMTIGNAGKHLFPRREPGQPLGKKRIAISIGGILLFFVAAFLIFASVATYTNTNLPLSKMQRDGLKVFLYHLPFLPKTPEQILLVAIDKNTQILTANPDFSLSAAVGSSTLTIASLDLRVRGPVDFTPNKTFATDVSVDADASLGGSSFTVSGNVVQKDGVSYFKITKLPDYLLSFLTNENDNAYGSSKISQTEQQQIKKHQQQVFSKWIIYNDNTIQSPAKDNLEKNNESLISQAQADVQDFFLKTNTLPEVKRVADETINGVPTYHLTLNPSKQLIKQILLNYAISQSDQSTYVTNPSQDFANFANSFTNVQIDLWIGKNDSIVRKLSLKSNLDLGFLQQALGSSDNQSTIPTDLLGIPNLEQAVNPTLTVSTVLFANNINKPVTITKPSPTVSYDEYVSELTEASKTSEQLEVDKKLATFTKDAYTIRFLLTKEYIQNGKYPQSVTDLASMTTPSDPIVKKLSNYQYKVSTDGSEYVVYAQLSNDIPNLDYYTPYYGFTSDDQDVHQLLDYEFDTVNNTPHSSDQTPTPGLLNDSGSNL